MFFFSRVFLLVALLGSAVSQVTFLAPASEAISGSWVQAYSSNLLNTTFEKHGFCVQVYVALGESGVKSVTIGLNLFSPTGVAVLVTPPNFKANADNSYSYELETDRLTISSKAFGFIALSPIDAATNKYTWASKFLLYSLHSNIFLDIDYLYMV